MLAGCVGGCLFGCFYWSQSEAEVIKSQVQYSIPQKTNNKKQKTAVGARDSPPNFRVTQSIALPAGAVLAAAWCLYMRFMFQFSFLSTIPSPIPHLSVSTFIVVIALASSQRGLIELISGTYQSSTLST